jgi:hypothetical protein
VAQTYPKSPLIGRVNETTGKIVPADGRGRKNTQDLQPKKRGPVPALSVKRCFYGATYLFDPIGDNLRNYCRS